MKTTHCTVVYDATYGFGPTFYVAEAEIGDKTIRINGTRHRKSTQRFAVATKELIAEVTILKLMRRELEERARIFKEKLDSLQPK